MLALDVSPGTVTPYQKALSQQGVSGGSSYSSWTAEQVRHTCRLGLLYGHDHWTVFRQGCRNWVRPHEFRQHRPILLTPLPEVDFLEVRSSYRRRALRRQLTTIRSRATASPPSVRSGGSVGVRTISLDAIPSLAKGSLDANKVSSEASSGKVDHCILCYLTLICLNMA